METSKQYYAFISYKREDKKWAEWLQHKLEHYRFPTNLNGRTDLPKNIRPTFRDVSELAAGVLADEIDKALHNSEWLIVICSPRSAKSQWVCKEAQTFIDLGREDHIIPFVIEGEPFSKDPSRECFPDALINLIGGKELLAVNINEMGRDAAAIKVVARMFSLRFDTLWQRHEREQRRKRKWTIAIGIIAFLFLASIAVWIFSLYIRSNNQNKSLLIQQERLYAKQASQLLKDNDPFSALLLLNELTDEDGIFTDIPLQAEAEYQMQNAITNYNKSYFKPLEIIKNENGVKFSPKGNYLAKVVSGDFNRYVKLFDADTYEEYMCYPCPQSKGSINYSISNDDKFLAISAWHNIFIYNIESGEIIKEYEDSIHNIYISEIEFSADNNHIIYTGSSLNTPQYTMLKVLDYVTEEFVFNECYEISQHYYRRLLDDLHVNEDGTECLLEVDVRRRNKDMTLIKVWETKNWNLIFESPTDETDFVRFFDNDNVLVLTKEYIYKLNIKTQQKTLFSPWEMSDTNVRDIYVLPNKKSIIAFCGHQLLHIDAENGDILGGFYSIPDMYHNISGRDSIFIARFGHYQSSSYSQMIYKIPEPQGIKKEKEPHIVIITDEKWPFYVLPNGLYAITNIGRMGEYNRNSAFRIADENNNTCYYDDNYSYSNLLLQYNKNTLYAIAEKENTKHLVEFNVENEGLIESIFHEIDIDKIYSISYTSVPTTILCERNGELCEWNAGSNVFSCFDINKVYHANYNPKNDWFIVVDSLGYLTQYKRNSKNESTRFQSEFKVKNATYTNDGGKIIVVTNNNNLLLLNSKTMEIEKTLSLDFRCDEIVITNNCNFVYLANKWGKTFYKLDIHDFKIRDKIETKWELPWCFSADGSNLVTYYLFSSDQTSSVEETPLRCIPIRAQQEIIEQARQIVGRKPREGEIDELLK